MQFSLQIFLAISHIPDLRKHSTREVGARGEKMQRSAILSGTRTGSYDGSLIVLARRALETYGSKFAIGRATGRPATPWITNMQRLQPGAVPFM